MILEEKAKRKKGVLVLALAVVGVVGLAVLFDLACGGKFLNTGNINSLCINAIMASFVAWGYCFVFALGYMDLSVGAAMILCAYAAGELGNRLGLPGVLLGGLAMGIILMSINFNVFAWTGIPSWIAGLGLLMLYEAAAAFYTYLLQQNAEVVVTLDQQYRTLGRAPAVYLVFLAGLAVAYIAYNWTAVGLNVRAIGSNLDVAKNMGIHIPLTLVLVGIICGFFIGCAGMLRESYTGRVFAQTGLTSLSSIFQPLATVLLAQVVEKKVNIILAVPFCALFVFTCFNVLTILGVPSGTLQESILGLCVIIFGVIAQRCVKGCVK